MKVIPRSTAVVAFGTAFSVMVGAYAYLWLLALPMPPPGYFVLLGVVAAIVALIFDNGKKARPVKEAILGGGAFAILSSLGPAFLPSLIPIPQVSQALHFNVALAVEALMFFANWVVFSVCYAGFDYFAES